MVKINRKTHIPLAFLIAISAVLRFRNNDFEDLFVIVFCRLIFLYTFFLTEINRFVCLSPYNC